WLVPGLLKDKIVELLRNLPKNYRVSFVPAPQYADNVIPLLRPYDTPSLESLAEALYTLTEIRVPRDSWQPDELPVYLHLNYAVVDKNGKRIAAARDLERVKISLRSQIKAALAEIKDPRYNRDNVTEWDFGDLPEHVEVRSRGLEVVGYPALLEQESATGASAGTNPSAALRLLESREAARR